MNNYCPCGNNKNYQDCCEPLIMGTKVAETAEQLMRSRYTAFTLAKINYIMKTHHSSSRPLKERNNMLKWMNNTEWLGLVVVKTEAGQVKDSSGTVEFRAIYLEDGQTQVIHEKSLFERENGQWVYISGTHY